MADSIAWNGLRIHSDANWKLARRIDCDAQREAQDGLIAGKKKQCLRHSHARHELI